MKFLEKMLDIFSFFVYTVPVMNKPFYNKLKNSSSEETFKSRWVKHFSKMYEKYGQSTAVETKERIDHYTEFMLYEFKYKNSFLSKEEKVKVLTQALYYVHHIYVGRMGYRNVKLPAYIGCISMFNGFIVKTSNFSKYYKSKKYDWLKRASEAWRLAASGKNLFEDLMNDPIVDEIVVYDFRNESEEKIFIDYHNSIFSGTPASLKLGISVENLALVFDEWSKQIGRFIAKKIDDKISKPHFLRECFLEDVSGKTSFDDKTKKLTISDKLIVQIPNYDNFWKNYDKIESMKEITHIRQHADRLLNIDLRKMQGAFYTPPVLAERAVMYIEDKLGEIDWDSGKVRLFDCAGGLGNLISVLPKNAWKYCYISTIEQGDVDYNSVTYPGVTSFQYDYINDDIIKIKEGRKIKYVFDYSKLPQNMIEDLNNPEITWIILVNPPYGQASTPGNETGKESKDGITSSSLVREMMLKDKLTKASTKEFYSQFIYRICKEFEGKKAYLGMFSKIMYINGEQNESLRDLIFRKEFMSGFYFFSKKFHGVKGEYPIMFGLWDLNTDIHLKGQTITLNRIEDNYEDAGVTKTIVAAASTELLNKNYFERPDRETDWVGYSGALNYTNGENYKIKTNTIADGFLFAMRTPGNSMKEKANSFISSAPSMAAGGYSITESNWKPATVAFSVRMSQKVNWETDNDVFYLPYCDVNEEFINDCIVFSLVCDGNYTSSIKSFDYNGVQTRIKCNVFPFTHAEVKSWECYLDDITEDLEKDTDDRFYARKMKEMTFSDEAQDVIEAMRNLYKYFFLHCHEGDYDRWEVHNWDVGVYQVKNLVKGMKTQDGKILLKTLSTAKEKLRAKIDQQSHVYGFVR